MVSKETIKEIVDEEMTKIIDISELDLYRVTANIPPKGLKSLIVYNESVLSWIKQIVESDNKITTPEVKIQIIQEILERAERIGE